VILTGHGSEREEREARRLGAFEYLEKPADTKQLLRTVRAAWKKGLALLKESADGFSRTMTAAALAEGGLVEEARRESRKPPVAAPESAAVESPEAADSAAPSLRVLFVDDEEDFVTTMAERMRLRDVGGEVALSGDRALEMLEDDVPDVMVLDLRMPGMDGMEVLRRVKKAYPGVQVIILTGHGSEQDEEEARRLGAFDYLCKPVDIGLLVETIRRAGHAGRATV
jgi:DNA-binding NtrC family response regulator